MEQERDYRVRTGQYPHVTTVNLTKEQHKALSDYCEDMDTTMSETIRILVEEYLKIVSAWDIQK